MRFIIYACSFLLIGCPKKQTEVESPTSREQIFLELEDEDLDDLPEADIEDTEENIDDFTN